MRVKGAAQGPYGPDNPPPPPAGPPPQDLQRRSSDDSASQAKSSRNRPSKSQRRRAYAEAEAEKARDRRDRSLSPDCRDQRSQQSHFRERSPLRCDNVDTSADAQSSNRERKQIIREDVRCYACNELGKWLL